MRTRTRCLWLLMVLLAVRPAMDGLASEARETPIVRAIKRCKHAVVNIHTEKTSRERDGVFDSGAKKGAKVNGMGTGILIDERGYIVTNQHVIADVEALRVTLLDGSTYHATIVSFDRKHDLAVIKIEAGRNLGVLPLGTSSDLMLGETVLAVGNAFGYEHTITAGIISQLHRDVEVNETQSYQNLIQTDASINPGNSGGPLINLDGEVIGINVAIRSGAQRIGFAIPIDDARKYIAKLLSTRELDETYHGIVGRDEKSAEQRRLIVEAADPNSPAAQAGLQAGDVLVQVGTTRVVDSADLERALLGHQPGDAVEVVVRRDEEPLTVKLQLARDNGVVRTASARTKGGVTVAKAPVAKDKTWTLLGLRMARAQATEVAGNAQFRGGMKVIEVRTNSPAAQAGFQRGDVLVGLHEWETTKSEDVAFVVNHPQLSTFNPLKFFILRNGNTHSGKLTLE